MGYGSGSLVTGYATQEEYENAISAAYSSWNNAGANFEFFRGENVYYSPGYEPPGIYQVGWYIDTNDPALAETIVTPYGDDIVDAQTYFNQANELSVNPSIGQFDIESTILHEFGHWLALDDEYSFSCINNVMYYSLDFNEIRRDLTEDDKNGIAYIYGDNPGSPLDINPFLNHQDILFESSSNY